MMLSIIVEQALFCDPVTTQITENSLPEALKKA
jgi:hypothetical protein